MTKKAACDIGGNEIRCGFPEKSSRPLGDKMVRLHAAVKGNRGETKLAKRRSS